MPTRQAIIEAGADFDSLRFAYASDTGEVFVIPEGLTGANSRRLAYGNYVDITAPPFNAVGGGEVDDTAAILAAVAAAKIAKLPIYVPSANFKFNGTISLDWDGAGIIGHPDNLSSLTTTSTSASVIKVPADWNGAQIENLWLNGPGESVSTGYGIEMLGQEGGSAAVDFAIIRKCRVTGFSKGAYLHSVSNSRVELCAFIDNGTGVHLLGNSNSTTFANCAFVAATTVAADKVGLRLSQGSGCQVIGCDAGGAKMETAFLNDGATSPKIQGGNIEHYGKSAIKVTGANSMVIDGVAILHYGSSADRYSLEMGSGTVSVRGAAAWNVSNPTTGAHIRKNSTIGRGLLVEGQLKVADYTSSAAPTNSPFMVYGAAGGIGTITEASGEESSPNATNHGVTWRRVYTGTNERWYTSIKNAAGTYEFANQWEYHWDKKAGGGGSPVFASASTTFTGGIQRVTNASNPGWSVTTSGYVAAYSQSGIFIATGANNLITGAAVGDTVIPGKCDGDIVFGTNTGTTQQTERMRVRKTGSVNFKPLAAAPSSPQEGDEYYDSVLKKKRTWDGTTWQDHW